MKSEEEILYIARNYREGSFNTETTLRRLKGKNKRILTPFRLVAASLAFIVLSAVAGVLIYKTNSFEEGENKAHAQITNNDNLTIIKSIDFEDAPLPDVIEKIKETYNIEIIDLPQNNEEYRLSLHFEGNIEDLIDVINETLKTELKIKEE